MAEWLRSLYSYHSPNTADVVTRPTIHHQSMCVRRQVMAEVKVSLVNSL